MASLYAYLLVAAISAIATWQVQNWRFAANERDRLEMEAKELARKADRVDKAAVRHEKDKVRIETKHAQVVKEIPREVAKPIYKNTCIDQPGVDNVNSLIDTYGGDDDPHAK